MSALQELLERYPASVGDLALKLRTLILDTLNGADESVDSKAGVVGYGRGPGYKKAICTIILSGKGVKLGLVGGASLPDPSGLLAGTGKVHKFVQIDDSTDLSNPAVRELLLQAAAAEKVRSES